MVSVDVEYIMTELTTRMSTYSTTRGKARHVSWHAWWSRKNGCLEAAKRSRCLMPDWTEPSKRTLYLVAYTQLIFLPTEMRGHRVTSTVSNV